MFGLVDISDSMWCPLKMYVSDIARAKNPTTAMAAITVIRIVFILFLLKT
jgi:hypothetical protein